MMNLQRGKQNKWKNLESYLHKINQEKKLQEYKKKKGINKLGKNSDIDSIIKDQSLPSWKYGIEIKTHKDTFDVRKKSMKNNNLTSSTYQKKISTLNTIQHFNNSEDNFYSEVNSNLLSSKRNPLIMFEVNVRDNLTERLEIFNLESAFNVCDDFCVKHKLPEEKKQYLYKLISEKMKEIN